MIDFGIFEIKTEIFVGILSVFALALQLLLCFKVKKRLLRLIPVILFAAATAVFFLLTFLSEGWDSIGFLLLAVFAAALLLTSGIGWGIWALIHHHKTKR